MGVFSATWYAVVKVIPPEPYEVAVEAYDLILKKLDPDFPGRAQDIFNANNLDRPMAYGLILSAEANRFRYARHTDALNRTRICGKWFLDHSDLNQNGIHGFGLADSSDAFLDGSVNPPYHEYTITTSLAVKGLLDWYDIETSEDDRVAILACVSKCLKPYFDDRYDSEAGIPGYSFAEVDREYGVFNSATILAGLLQRFSHLVDDAELKETLAGRAKKIIDATMAQGKIDTKGNYIWKYGVKSGYANDLLHVSYIVEGIREFTIYGGKLSDEWSKVFNHTYSFTVDNFWYEHHAKTTEAGRRKTRLWGLGMVMYSLAMEKDYGSISDGMIAQVMKHHRGKGRFTILAGGDLQNLRHEAHLLMGLSYFLFNEESLKIIEEREFGGSFMGQESVPNIK